MAQSVRFVPKIPRVSLGRRATGAPEASGRNRFPAAHPIRAWDETAGRKKDHAVDDSYKLVIVAVLGLAGAAAFFTGKDQPRNGFLLFVAALALGFRTLSITESLRIHPAEIALLLVLLISVGGRPAGDGTKAAPLP